MDIPTITPRQLSPSQPTASQNRQSDEKGVDLTYSNEELRAMSTPPIGNLDESYKADQVVGDFQLHGKIPTDHNDKHKLISWCLHHKEFHALSWLATRGEIIDCFTLDKERVKNLAEWLKRSPPVTALHLTECIIGNEGAQALAAVLGENNTLTTLDLTSCGIGNTGATAIALALKKNRTLAVLMLLNNRIGARGAKALADALTENDALTMLDLRHNKIGAAGAKEIALALKRNRTLIKLNLRNCAIGDAGAHDMASAIKENCTLKFLELGVNGINAGSVAELAFALKENQTLYQLDIGGNRFPEAIYKEINKSLDANYEKRIQRATAYLNACMGIQDFTLNISQHLYQIAPDTLRALSDQM